jgi:hypothetical protein
VPEGASIKPRGDETTPHDQGDSAQRGKTGNRKEAGPITEDMESITFDEKDSQDARERRHAAPVALDGIEILIKVVTGEFPVDWHDRGLAVFKNPKDGRSASPRILPFPL